MCVAGEAELVGCWLLSTFGSDVATERSERFTIKGQSLLPKSEHPPDSQTWFKGGLQMFGTVWVVFYRGIRLSMPGSK